MTLDEAKAIGRAIQGADGGCSYCVRDIIDELMARFPEWVWEWEESDYRHVTARARRDGDRVLRVVQDAGYESVEEEVAP